MNSTSLGPQARNYSRGRLIDRIVIFDSESDHGKIPDAIRGDTPDSFEAQAFRRTRSDDFAASFATPGSASR